MRKTLFLLIMLSGGLLLGSCSKKEESKKAPVTTVKKKVEKKLKEVDQTATLAGKIDGKYAVNMTLDCKGNVVTGTYYYVKNGPGATLNLKGTLDEEGNLDIHETNDEGRPTGHFEGVYGKSHGYQGVFVNFKGDKMPFELNVLDVEDNAGDGDDRGFLYDYEDDREIPSPYSSSRSSFDDDDDDDYGYDDDDDAPKTSRGSISFDKWLDDYEAVANKYVSVVDKYIKTNDVTVMAELSEIMDKYENLQKEVDINEMSSSQVARFNKIVKKMTDAIQKLQKYQKSM